MSFCLMNAYNCRHICPPPKLSDLNGEKISILDLLVKNLLSDIVDFVEPIAVVGGVASDVRFVAIYCHQTLLSCLAATYCRIISA